VSLVVVPGFLAPLLAVFTYRRAGLGWRSATGLGVLGVMLALVGGIVIGFVYGLWVAVEAGLCGSSTPAPAIAAGVVAYLVVATWAALRPRRVWAWTFSVGAGLAAEMLVAYFFAGAHGYCET
jgi:hypothetical protein